MRVVAFILALLAPLPALALSCMAPTVERSYERFAAADEIYQVVHGRVAFDAQLLPKAGLSGGKPPDMTRIPAQLVGKSLGKSGFKFPFDHEITLEVSCLGPWCGGVLNGEDLLAFVRRSDAGYVLAIPPCGGSAFSAPKPAQLKKVKQCFLEGGCGS